MTRFSPLVRPERRSGTIRTQLFIAFMAMVLLPAIVISGVTGVLGARSGRQQAFNQLESVATLKEAEISAWVHDLQTDLDVVALSGTETGRRIRTLLAAAPDSIDDQDTRDELQVYFEQFIGQAERYEELFLMNLEGRVILSTNVAQEGKIYANEAYFREGLARNHVQPPLFYPSLARTTVIAARPIPDEDGQVLGVLAGRASMATLSQIMEERAGLGETGETYLVGGNNVLLTALRTNQQGNYIRTDGVNTALALRANGSDTYLNAQGVSLIGVYHWLPELQVVLLAEQNQAEALRTTYTMLATIGSVILGATALAVMVSLSIITRRIVTPLTNLAKTATQIAAGELDRNADVERSDEIGTLAQAFNTMTAQLRELIGSLEQRVAQRTHRLEIIALLSERLSAILDLELLLTGLVNQVKDNFGYYHAHVYLLDNTHQNLVMTAGTGMVGAEMKAKGHYIPLDAPASLVARAARTGEIVWVSDVREVRDWLPNPLLQDTYSEMVVPIMLEGQVVGVLDVQEDRVAGFDEGDANLLRSLAGHVAVAIRNAQLFEDVIIARQEAEKANELKTDFLAKMSHELRTPLNAIINFTGFVADGLMGDINEQQREYLSKTVDSGEHLLSLINDVLDLAKVEAGSMNLFIEEVHMNTLIHHVLGTANGLIKNKPIDLIVQVEEGLPTIMGDKRRIRQILLNLISNAIKYTMEGKVTVTAEPQKDAIHITVQDTGIGITPEDYNLVFQSFTQARHNLENVTSSGLGLPITKQLVELHGGQIWFESAVGVGTTFHVLLPRWSQPNEGFVELKIVERSV